MVWRGQLTQLVLRKFAVARAGNPGAEVAEREGEWHIDRGEHEGE